MSIVWKRAQALVAGGVWKWPDVWNYNTVPQWESYAAGNVNTVIDVTALTPAEWGDYALVRHGKLIIRQEEASPIPRGVLAANWGQLPLQCLPMKVVNLLAPETGDHLHVRNAASLTGKEVHALTLGEEVQVWRTKEVNGNLWALIRPDPSGVAPWWCAMVLSGRPPYLISTEA